MFLGIDIGTSGVKAVLVDNDQTVIAQANSPLELSRPKPLWSEQDPEDWWRGVEDCIAQLKDTDGKVLAAVQAIGLSGQMHGATLLDDAGRVLRPAILWNDGRSGDECAELEQAEPRSRAITGNLAMPGFTAPKLKWVAKREPEIFVRTAKVLLPKDYVRLRLTGEYVSEMSDAAGTLWLDVARRDWSDEMLAATGLTRDHMPRLVEGSEASGQLRDTLANAWGMNKGVIVAGGAGDNAAGAAGVGTVVPGRAFVSLGTSGVYFVASEAFSPNPGKAVHAFCHCLPNVWHQMSVILSAASCLTWVTTLTGAASESELLEEIEATEEPAEPVTFLPYLSGERTPLNNPHAKGVFFGLTHGTDRAVLGRAVLEGVALAFAEGQAALIEAGTAIDSVSVIGGGARSLLWGRILAAALDRPLIYHRGAELGPAFGAARLARLAANGEDPADVCLLPEIDHIVEPDSGLRDAYAARRPIFRDLYRVLEPAFLGEVA